MDQATLRDHAAAGFHRVPLVREVFADLETALSAYLKLARGPYSYLFESVQGGEKWGRYSIIGLPCRELIRVRGETITVERDGAVVETIRRRDPLIWIEEYRLGLKVAEPPGLPRFFGGLVGYFGYDTVRYAEPRLSGVEKPDALGDPDILLLRSEEVAVFDNLRGKLSLIVHVDPREGDALERGTARLDELEAQLAEPLQWPAAAASGVDVAEHDFVSGFTQAGFEAAVARAREYIVDGDIMQVVLSQRLSVPLKARPLDLYRALHTLNPSPYMYFLDLGGTQVVGSSPEILVRLDDDEVTVRPIAGTRPRGTDAAEDEAYAREMLADEKERAEHLMLVDLARNDVGRVSRFGTVTVNPYMEVKKFSHVMHLVSQVQGELAEGSTPFEALTACLPAGTLSGAPKIRAMEIIDQLETKRRGPYGGAVGYFSYNGSMDTCITIRSVVFTGGSAYVQAGAGIVEDSVPQAEYEESVRKASGLLEVLQAPIREAVS